MRTGWRMSKLATHVTGSPSSLPCSTSVEMSRTVRVIGATTILLSTSVASLRVTTSPVDVCPQLRPTRCRPGPVSPWFFGNHGGSRLVDPADFFVRLWLQLIAKHDRIRGATARY